MLVGASASRIRPRGGHLVVELGKDQEISVHAEVCIATVGGLHTAFMPILQKLEESRSFSPHSWCHSSSSKCQIPHSTTNLGHTTSCLMQPCCFRGRCAWSQSAGTLFPERVEFLHPPRVDAFCFASCCFAIALRGAIGMLGCSAGSC